MKSYSLKHLPDDAVSRGICSAEATTNEATADFLAFIAEHDARKLYLPAAYSSMLSFCVEGLKLSDDVAKKLIHVARAALRCPAVFHTLAGGRVHLAGLRILAPHLTPENVDDLLTAATHKTRTEIEELVAARFPREPIAAEVRPIEPPAGSTGDEGAPGHPAGFEMTAPSAGEGAPGHPQPATRVMPLSAEAYAVQFTRNAEQDERFRYLQDLLGHKVGRGDIAKVYSLAIEELIAKIERKRFAASAMPRGGRHRSGANSRYISADVRRAVCQRDKCQCTFVSESGRRCEMRGDLGFMERKRAEAAASAAKKRTPRESDAPPPEPPAGTDEHDVYLALRSLGHRDGDARRAVALCADVPEASRQDKLRLALKYFPQRGHSASSSARAMASSD